MSGAGTQVLGEALERFEGELRQLAWQLVRVVLEKELARRPKARPSKEPRRARAVAKPKPAPMPRRRKATAPQLELHLAPAAPGAAPAQKAAEVAAAPKATEVAPAAVVLATGKRRKWTRDSIIEELATWMVNGTALDAQFLTRHGPAGLVAAARRIFGRFDAALNVAGLHFARLYPDGPPVRKRGAPGPASASSAVPPAPAAAPIAAADTVSQPPAPSAE